MLKGFSRSKSKYLKGVLLLSDNLFLNNGDKIVSDFLS